MTCFSLSSPVVDIRNTQRSCAVSASPQSQAMAQEDLRGGKLPPAACAVSPIASSSTCSWQPGRGKSSSRRSLGVAAPSLPHATGPLSLFSDNTSPVLRSAYKEAMDVKLLCKPWHCV